MVVVGGGGDDTTLVYDDEFPTNTQHIEALMRNVDLNIVGRVMHGL